MYNTVDMNQKLTFIDLSMMSVKTHGGKTIRTEVTTQHAQKNLQRNFKAKKYILGSRPYTLKKL